MKKIMVCVVFLTALLLTSAMADMISVPIGVSMDNASGVVTCEGAQFSFVPGQTLNLSFPCVVNATIVQVLNVTVVNVTEINVTNTTQITIINATCPVVDFNELVANVSAAVQVKACPQSDVSAQVAAALGTLPGSVQNITACFTTLDSCQNSVAQKDFDRTAAQIALNESIKGFEARLKGEQERSSSLESQNGWMFFFILVQFCVIVALFGALIGDLPSLLQRRKFRQETQFKDVAKPVKKGEQ